MAGKLRSHILCGQEPKKKKKSNRRNIDLKKIGPHQKQTNRKQTNKQKPVKFCLCQTFIWILVDESQCQSLYIRIVKLYWKGGKFIDKIR